MTTPERTLAELAAAGFDDETRACWEKYQALPQDVKEALDEMVAYDQRQKARIKALEAFARHVLSTVAARPPLSSYEGHHLAEEANMLLYKFALTARSLLAGSESEVGDG